MGGAGSSKRVSKSVGDVTDQGGEAADPINVGTLQSESSLERKIAAQSVESPKLVQK